MEALRAFSRLPHDEHPPWLVDVARTSLALWRGRAEHKPYMFGHGRSFKTVKWPPTWYGAYEVVDALGRLPETWDGPGAAAESRQEAWRFVVQTAVGMGIPVLALSASLAYFDAYRSERLPANLTQAQRDYFGAHTYRRVDREGTFHTEWN